jgi:DNA-binding transcriptional LysR family regulator
MTIPAQWNDRLRRRLKLREIDILLAIFQAGSMGRAAKALNMSQPVISKAIANLELNLGVRLLDRSRQGVELTPYGRAFVKRGVAAFDELRQGVQDIAFLTDPKAGEIRLGGSDYVISALFSPVMHRFSRLYPKLFFRVIVADLRTLCREIDDRKIDLAVCRIFRPLSDEYKVETLFQDSLVAVAGANNPLTRRRRIEFDDLIEQPWTLQPADNDFGAFVLDSFRSKGHMPPSIAIASTSYALRGEFLATGQYLTMVPAFWMRQPHKHSSLRVLPVEFPHTRHDVALITLKNRSLNRATELFVEDIRTLARRLGSSEAAKPARRRRV